MRFLLFLLLLPLSAASQSGADRAVLDTELRRFDAMTRQDTARLRDMLSDDLLYIHSNTLTENKTEHLANIGAKTLVYEKITPEKTSIRRYGKTALTNGVILVRGILKGNTFDIRLMYTAVYHKKKGAWRLVSWQSTRIP